jgi:hypothetical protein
MGSPLFCVENLRGELVPQNPDDERVSVLLERIHQDGPNRSDSERERKHRFEMGAYRRVMERHVLEIPRESAGHVWLQYLMPGLLPIFRWETRRPPSSCGPVI